MNNMERLVAQHEEFKKLTEEILALSKNDGLTKNADTIRKLLSTLAGKVKIHLAVEDQTVYPRLLKHEDSRISNIAKEYINDMGHIKDTFKEYLLKWPAPSAIRENPNIFFNETRNIFMLLSQRIDKENRQLYPLLD